ncbi:MAG: cobalamin biosynthesis protein [Methanobacterium sp. PtaU1.Bin097]|jgi:adenosylcobinamide-phosphate synthase|nr:MAG: cobalamin biosynthesis protein [Methanobacterium sp. PtaU1.Bin097]
MELLSVILLAIILDLLWGEPPSSIHPVVLMGRLIDFLKPHLLRYRNKSSGIILTVILLAVFTIPLYFILQLLQFSVIIYVLVAIFILFTTFAIKGLTDSVKKVKQQLNEDINLARQSVSHLVSRDTTDLSKEGLASAAVESLTENITDSVISPLFYTFFLGVPGAMAYRVINTLDAMVGYKDEINKDIGWFPAKLDDIANYIPARLTGILMVASAAFMGLDWRNSYRTMIGEARKTPSPNSGYPMAAAAGALGVRLEKKGVYTIGEGKNPLNPEIIEQAILLSQITIIFFLVISFIIYSGVIIVIT